MMRCPIVHACACFVTSQSYLNNVFLVFYRVLKHVDMCTNVRNKNTPQGGRQ